jgi:hypothetical protein
MRARSKTLNRLHWTLMAALVLLVGALPSGAAAERPATPSEFAAINRLLAPSARTLNVKLAWVKVSTRGPFALAYMNGPGQVGATLLRGSGQHWTYLATISDEGLRCGLAPPAVIADLHAERFNEGPKPCSKS